MCYSTYVGLKFGGESATRPPPNFKIINERRIMTQKSIFIENAHVIWQSPDGKRTINEINARGETVPFKTYSPTIPGKVGQTVDVMVDERQGKNGVEYWLTSPQKEGYTGASNQTSFVKQERNDKTSADIARSVAYKGVIELIVAGKVELSEIENLVDQHTHILTEKPVEAKIEGKVDMPETPVNIDTTTDEIPLDDIPF